MQEVSAEVAPGSNLLPWWPIVRLLHPLGMPETTQHQEAPQDSKVLLATEKLHPPMYPWQTALLCLTTFTLYAPFSLYRHARDLSIVDTEPRTRWLWFLSPLFSFSLIFSLAKLFERIEIISGKRFSYAIGIGLIVFGANLLIRVADLFDTGFGVYLFAITIVSAAFGYVQAASNELKRDSTANSFTSPPHAYTVGQWLALIFGLLIQLSVAALIWLGTETYETIESFANESTYTNKEYDFVLTMYGDGWEQVPAGSFSDGSAVAEFNGPASDHYLLVFKRDKGDSVDSQLQYRLEQIEENESPRVKCDNTRTMHEPSMTLIATLNCSGRTTFGDYLREVSYIREIGDHRLEVLGRIAAPKLTTKTHDSNLLDTIRSLSKRHAN